MKRSSRAVMIFMLSALSSQVRAEAWDAVVYRCLADFRLSKRLAKSRVRKLRDQIHRSNLLSVERGIPENPRRDDIRRLQLMIPRASAARIGYENQISAAYLPVALGHSRIIKIEQVARLMLRSSIDSHVADPVLLGSALVYVNSRAAAIQLERRLGIVHPVLGRRSDQVHLSTDYKNLLFLIAQCEPARLAEIREHLIASRQSSHRSCNQKLLAFNVRLALR